MNVSQILVFTVPALMRLMASAARAIQDGKVLPAISVRVTHTNYYVLIHFLLAGLLKKANKINNNILVVNDNFE